MTPMKQTGNRHLLARSFSASHSPAESAEAGAENDMKQIIDSVLHSTGQEAAG